jgi:hypothetical protein
VSDLVKLRHPSLPPDQVIEIDRARIGLRLGAGWEEAPAEAPKPEPAESDRSEQATESEPSDSAPKRRSRKTTEEQ